MLRACLHIEHPVPAPLLCRGIPFCSKPSCYATKSLPHSLARFSFLFPCSEPCCVHSITLCHSLFTWWVISLACPFASRFPPFLSIATWRISNRVAFFLYVAGSHMSKCFSCCRNYQCNYGIVGWWANEAKGKRGCRFSCFEAAEQRHDRTTPCCLPAYCFACVGWTTAPYCARMDHFCLDHARL